MKTKTFKLFSTIALIAITSLVYTGCKKKEDPKAAPCRQTRAAESGRTNVEQAVLGASAAGR